MIKDVMETAAWEKSRGEFSVISIPAIILSIENSFIARGYIGGYRNSEVPVCHFLRCYFAGLAEAFKGNGLDSEEIKCVAKGDECCEFVMKRAD